MEFTPEQKGEIPVQYLFDNMVAISALLKRLRIAYEDNNPQGHRTGLLEATVRHVQYVTTLPPAYHIPQCWVEPVTRKWSDQSKVPRAIQVWYRYLQAHQFAQGTSAQIYQPFDLARFFPRSGDPKVQKRQEEGWWVVPGYRWADGCYEAEMELLEEEGKVC